jgi:hypothetical protein
MFCRAINHVFSTLANRTKESAAVLTAWPLILRIVLRHDEYNHEQGSKNQKCICYNNRGHLIKLAAVTMRNEQFTYSTYLKNIIGMALSISSSQTVPTYHKKAEEATQLMAEQRRLLLHGVYSIRDSVSHTVIISCGLTTEDCLLFPVLGSTSLSL